MQVIVLGAGLVGSAIVKDLSQDAAFSVTVVDVNQEALDRVVSRASAAPVASAASVAPVQGIRADLRQGDVVASVVSDADLVICAVPGFMGFTTLRHIIEAGKDVVDISFFAEDAFALDELAKRKGVTAVVDCGVAPGLCNILAGHVESLMDEVMRYVCYVGGLPRVRTWPYEYRAVFSPVDVLEEYTRPARFVEYGHEVVRPALSDVELRDFPGVGTLEAFNTDGLRSLRHTLKAPFMLEKTLRYPGHAALMRVFRESGFFGTEPVEVGGQAVRPIDLTARLLFEQWTLPPGEEDLTVMQVVLEGRKDGAGLRYTYDLLDHYDRATDTTSMARTTGYTATIVARQVARGLFNRKGISPPEYVGHEVACYQDLLAGYAERDIHVEETVTGF